MSIHQLNSLFRGLETRSFLEGRELMRPEFRSCTIAGMECWIVGKASRLTSAMARIPLAGRRLRIGVLECWGNRRNCKWWWPKIVRTFLGIVGERRIKSIHSVLYLSTKTTGFVRCSEVTTMSSATGETIASIGNSRAIPCLPRANGSGFRNDRIWEKCS